MNEKSLFQKICAVAFLLFAVISCAATAQSLSLTLEMEIPTWLSFAIMFIFAFGLYLLTSYCFKLVIDAANADVYIEHRRRDFILGLFGVLLFWLVCSMPTNTHSLFYTKVVDNVVVAELDNQKETLENERALLGSDIEDLYSNKVTQFTSAMNSKFEQFKTEIDHPDRIGLGANAKEILYDIEEYCGYKRESYFNHTVQKSTSVAERTRIKNFYHSQFMFLLNDGVAKINEEMSRKLVNLDDEKTKLQGYITHIGRTKAMFNDESIAHQQRIKDARIVINSVYNMPDYKDKILDNVETLKRVNAGHEDSNVESYKIYKTERLHSVFKLWGDYLNGKMRNLDFDMFYWVIISVIIDIAGLLFFAIAFRKTY